MSRPLAAKFTTKVVGMTFIDTYPDNLLRVAAIQRRKADAGKDETLACVLIRNPKNTHDTNAVQVHVPAVGMIGHVPAAVAVRLAPELDSGVDWHCFLMPVRIHPDAPEQPGVDIRLERV